MPGVVRRAVLCVEHQAAEVTPERIEFGLGGAALTTEHREQVAAHGDRDQADGIGIGRLPGDPLDHDSERPAG